MKHRISLAVAAGASVAGKHRFPHVRS